MRILIADKLEPACVDALRKVGEVRLEPDAGPETLPGLFAEFPAEVLVVRSTKATAPVIESAPNLKLIVRAGAGVDNIDQPAASARGVSVCNCPGMNAVAVAEVAMGHLINLDRRLGEQTAELRAGHWNKGEYAKARGLKGLKLLVIGGGAIGLEVVKRAQAFGMEVSLQSPHMDESKANALGVGFVAPGREALIRLLPEFDAVTLHLPANDETRGMCDAEFFGAMKDGAYFINTARGPIVDEAALAQACRTKGIRAGLDVYCDQPGFKAGDWKPAHVTDIPNVSLTHHCGASTDQAQAAVGEEVVRIVQTFAKTGEALHCVNRDALAAGAAS